MVLFIFLFFQINRTHLKKCGGLVWIKVWRLYWMTEYSTLIEVMKWYLCGANIPNLKSCSSYP